MLLQIFWFLIVINTDPIKSDANHYQYGKYRAIYNPNLQKPNPLYPGDNKNSYEHSDSRCKNALPNEIKEAQFEVKIKHGIVVGRESFLCDSPDLKYWEKPGWNSNSYSNVKIRKKVHVFLGIPYAKAPLPEHDLRFKPPQPPLPFGTIDCAEFKPSCPQPTQFFGEDYNVFKTDEDCLYLNIYKPHASQNMKELYPVMIYIHGGDYLYGSGNIFPGHMLAATQEVIVVTFNYRLGLLGFFATADKSSPGNYGILDQYELIRWVNDNIHAFHGDPQKITLFGPGAGAASAGLLALSPLSRKYIKRVIASNGSPLAPWATMNDPYLVQNMSRVIGKTFGCSNPFTENLVSCLLSRSQIELQYNVKQDIGWLPFAPALDATTREKGYQFLPQTPKEILENGFLDSDIHFDAYMTGITRDAGSTRVLNDEDLKIKGYYISEDEFDAKVSQYIKIYNATLNPEGVKSAIRFMYTPWMDKTNGTLIRQGLIDMYTDSWYTASIDDTIKLLIKNKITTYMYVLNYTIEGLNRKKWLGINDDIELLLLTGAPFMDYKFFPKMYDLKNAKWTESDRNMSQFYMMAWANFAKYGQPMKSALFGSIYWEPVKANSLSYLSINATNHTSIMLRDFRQLQCQFWNEYLYSLVGSVKPTWPPYYQPLEDELRVYRASFWAVIAISIIVTFMAALCSCLYCRAKRDRQGDAALGLSLAETLSLSQQLSGASNSEISLNSKRGGDYGQTKRFVSSPNAKYKKINRIDKVTNTKSLRDNQTRV